MVPEKRVKTTVIKAVKCQKGARLDVDMDERKLKVTKIFLYMSCNIEKLSPVERISIGYK